MRQSARAQACQKPVLTVELSVCWKTSHKEPLLAACASAAFGEFAEAVAEAVLLAAALELNDAERVLVGVPDERDADDPVVLWLPVLVEGAALVDEGVAGVFGAAAPCGGAPIEFPLVLSRVEIGIPIQKSELLK